jgi:predicted dehydrogenase
MIRLGMIGCGNMAGSHLEKMAALADRLQITALVDIDEAMARQAAKFAPQARIATDYRDILDDIDAVLIALPHHLHHRIALDCLAAGKHTLLEKPLALTEEQCLDLVAADRSPDPVLMIGYVMRYDPLWAEMGRLIREKVYGDVFHLSIWTEQHTEHHNHWTNKTKTLGGGQLFSHGCHYIDLMLHWLGNPIQGTHMSTNFGTPWMEREGTSDVAIKFENGAVGYHMGTWGARGTKLGYSVHAHTAQGMLELNHNDSAIILHRHADGGGDLPALSDDIEMKSPDQALIYSGNTTDKAIEQQMNYFLNCIKNRSVPETNARIATQSLRVIWRLYHAEEQGLVADLRGTGLDQFSEEPDVVTADYSV